MRFVHLGVASLNPTVGAFRNNTDKAISCAEELSKAGVTVGVFSEQLIGGYPAEDWVHWNAFMTRQWEELLRFAKATASMPLVSCIGVGILHRAQRYNCAAVVCGGRVHGLVPKEKLPDYGIYYETRTTSRGVPGMRETHEGVPFGDVLFDFDFGRLGVEICEDLWSPDGPMRRRTFAGAELICNLSASPFRVGIDATRQELIATRAADNQCVIAYANQVGAQGSLIFDGGGYVNQNGTPLLATPRFTEGWGAVVVDMERSSRLRSETTTWREDQRIASAEPQPTVVAVERPATQRKVTPPFMPLHQVPEPPATTPKERFCEELLNALSLGVGDYYRKCGCFRAIGVALSGGRDSLLTLHIATRFAHPAKVPVEVFFMPSRFTSPETTAAARAAAKELGVRLTENPIDEAFERELVAVKAMLAPGVSVNAITEQNVQARIRAQRMWNWANSAQGLYLQTGNMSERAMGYTTVGGDLMGALSVIGNVPKTLVNYLLDYLAARLNSEAIRRTLATPAGPELAAGQRGEDELMPFPLLDACLSHYVGEKLSPAEVVAVLIPKFPELTAAQIEKAVERFVRLFSANLFKWVQAPLTLHVGAVDLDRERALQLPVVARLDF